METFVARDARPQPTEAGKSGVARPARWVRREFLNRQQIMFLNPDLVLLLLLASVSSLPASPAGGRLLTTFMNFIKPACRRRVHGRTIFLSDIKI
jgi:hypothetical protein